MVRGCSVAFVVLWCRLAAAQTNQAPVEEANRLVREGAALGAKGDFAGAIKLFKQATRVFARPLDDCNIGSAYAAMGGRPAQAQVFLERCRQAPEHAAFASQRLIAVMKELRSGKYGKLGLAVSPPGTIIIVSTFAPDEPIPSPVVLWLPHGMHRISFYNEGYHSLGLDLEVPNDTKVEHHMKPIPQPSPEPEPEPTPEPEPIAEPLPSPSPSPAPSPSPVPRLRLVTPPPLLAAPVPEPSDTPPAPRSTRRRWANILLYGGLATAAVGGIFHYLAYQSASRATDLPRGPAYDDETDSFVKLRAATIALYAAGSIGLGVGVYLHLTPTRAAPRRTVAMSIRGSF